MGSTTEARLTRIVYSTGRPSSTAVKLTALVVGNLPSALPNFIPLNREVFKMTRQTPSARMTIRARARFFVLLPSSSSAPSSSGAETLTLRLPAPRSFHSPFVKQKSLARLAKTVVSSSSPVSATKKRFF